MEKTLCLAVSLFEWSKMLFLQRYYPNYNYGQGLAALKGYNFEMHRASSDHLAAQGN